MPHDDRLIYLITKAQHYLKTYLQKAFDAAGLNITPVQASVLFLLSEEAHSMTHLSQILGIDNSAITGVVDRLEKAELAYRRTSPRDRRTFLIQISDKGRQELERAGDIVKRVNTEIKKGFSVQEINTFKSVLNSFFSKFHKGALK